MNHVVFQGRSAAVSDDYAGKGARRNYVAQFDLFMGNVPYAQSSPNYDVQVEYSKDLGVSWRSVQTFCSPSSTTTCNGSLVRNLVESGDCRSHGSFSEFELV